MTETAPPCSVDTHAIDLDDEPEEDLANTRPVENGHDAAEPMNEDREPDGNGAHEEGQPPSTDANTGE